MMLFGLAVHEARAEFVHPPGGIVGCLFKRLARNPQRLRGKAGEADLTGDVSDGIRDRHQSKDADKDDNEKSEDRAKVGDVFGSPKNIVRDGDDRHDHPGRGHRIHEVTYHG